MRQNSFAFKRYHRPKPTKLPPLVVLSQSRRRREIIIPAAVTGLIALTVIGWQTLSLRHYYTGQQTLRELVAEQQAELAQYVAANTEYARLLQDFPALQQQNEALLQENLGMLQKITEVTNENNALQKTVRLAALTGVAKPDDYRVVEAAQISRGDLPRGEYLGVWEGTVYTATTEETDNEPSISASGKLVAPGYTIAVDPQYWKLGTKFYIEGIGVVQAEDTGSKVKGRNRFDLLVSDKSFARKLGRFKANVWAYSQ